jgi:uncharacterized membrane protein YuzA (DUF378 family)
MEAFLQNPSLLLVDLIVAGVCVGVVFLTKFNFIDATLGAVNKFGEKATMAAADTIYDILGLKSVYKGLGGTGSGNSYSEIKQEYKQLKTEDESIKIIDGLMQVSTSLIPGGEEIWRWLTQ